MRTDPRYATTIGDRRYDQELEDLSPAAREATRRELLSIVDRLTRFDPASLSVAERLNRDVLALTITTDLQSEACEYELWRVDHLNGLQSSLPELATLHSTDTLERATGLVTRYQRVPRLIDQHIKNLSEGLRRGLVAPEINVRRVIEQIDKLIVYDPSPFLPRFDKTFAQDVPDAKEREKVFEELVRAVRALVDTSLVRYREFLKRAVLPEARKKVGVDALAIGAACYLAEIERHTGRRMTPGEVHALGLSEVGRIKAEMTALAQKLFPGKKLTLREANERLDKDPAQHFKTRGELRRFAEATVARALAASPKAFSVLPKAPIEVKPLEAFREEESPAAYYYQAPSDGSRPAFYYLNTFAPEERALYDQEALAFHEAVPGHHLQIALAQELSAVPEFRKQLGQTAFVEGWALYAERLAKELGLYSSDASDFGRLGYELWRAQRLVVDTGLHAMGWTREQAIAFMKDGSTTAEIEVVNEVDRDITGPGQALAYKIGELEIRRMRKKAEVALGGRFDLKAFHAQVLSGGALPLAIVEKRLDTWIDAQLATNTPDGATRP